MMEWYDNRLFGEININPAAESTEDDGVQEEDIEVDSNDLFFQLWEKEWEEHMLEVRLWLCGPNP